MEPQKERKPVPPIDVSLNYLSWTQKDFTKMMMQLPSLLEQINKNLEFISLSINRIADTILDKQKETPF
jgi:hypothetical protein